MNKIYYLQTSHLNSFFERIKKEYNVFSPVVKDAQGRQVDYYYQPAKDSASFLYNAYRTVEPLKSFFTHACEKVSDYFTTEKNVTETTGKTIVFGVKNCDIAGHKVQDFVFLEGVEVDSLYRIRRDNTILISGDCTDFKEVCHCLAWEIMPYPQDGFDLNFSPLSDGYLVEVGSAQGQGLIDAFKELFVVAKETQVSARKVKRDSLVERLKRHLLPQNLVTKDNAQKLVKDGYALDTWKEFMRLCVECGGCNLICDTCHCFILSDQKHERQNRKLRIWDSCLYQNYARVAGGANPLKTRAQRLRNRFMKKFDFFVDNLGMPACCGCGRCIEVCPGKIDIREVLKDLAKRLKQ